MEKHNPLGVAFFGETLSGGDKVKDHVRKEPTGKFHPATRGAISRVPEFGTLLSSSLSK